MSARKRADALPTPPPPQAPPPLDPTPVNWTTVAVSDDGNTAVAHVVDPTTRDVQGNPVVVGTNVGVSANPTSAQAVATTNAGTIRQKAAAALAANATFLALPSPTNAQVVAQVQRNAKECSAVIRLLLGLLDSTTGT